MTPYSPLEQRIVDNYLQGSYPEIPPETGATDLQEAAMGATVGTLPADAKNIPLSTFGKMAADVPAGLAKGAIQGTIGLPGDLISLGRGIAAAISPQQGEGRLDAFLRGTQGKTILPTTEDVRKFLDETLGIPLVPAGETDQIRREGAKVSETVGELFGAGKTAVEVGKATGRAAVEIGKELGPTAGKMAEDILRKQGLLLDVAPPGPQSIIKVKVGERDLNIPADQAAILQRAVKNLTPEEQAKFKSNTAQTFVNVLSQLPTKQEFAAAAIGGQAKRGWYEGSTQAILTVFGPDAPRFAALLSATSPQTSVESNLYNALQIWKNWTAAGRPTDREAIVRVMGQSVQGSKGEQSVLDAWINNSVSALSAEDPSKVILSGPKVNSFMLNLQGNVNEVTNDAWMAAFSLVDQKIFGGSLTKTDPGKGPGYMAMNARVRETADYLTKVTGDKWTPAEVQETIWSWAKTLYEMAGSAGEKRTAVQLIKDKAITDELIASTPDFRTLFYDTRFQPILEQSGYGEQLARLREATGTADVAARGQKPGASGKAGALDSAAQQRLNERNARRLDQLRRQREQASAEKAQVQNPSGGVE